MLGFNALSEQSISEFAYSGRRPVSMSNKNVQFQATDGTIISVIAIDTGTSDGRGNTLYRLGVDTEIDVGPISIGAVTIKDNTADTQATVKVVTSAAETDDALVVQAPVLGTKGDAADKAGGASTLNAKLRGLIQLFAAGIPAALGQAAMAASLPVTMASNQSAIPVTIAEDSELGQVKLLDSAGTNLGQIAAASAIAEAGSTKLAVHDPTLGISTGAAVITDANGTLQQYLRGLVKLAAAGLSVTIAAGTAAIGSVSSLGYASSVVHIIGISGARFTSSDQSATPAAVTSAPTSGKNTVIKDLVVAIGSVAQTVTFTEETSGTVLLTLYMVANTDTIISFSGKFKLATADKRLMVQTSILGAISVTPVWYSE